MRLRSKVDGIPGRYRIFIGYKFRTLEFWRLNDGYPPGYEVLFFGATE